MRSSYLKFLPIEFKTGVEHTDIQLPSEVETLAADPRFGELADGVQGLPGDVIAAEGGGQ